MDRKRSSTKLHIRISWTAVNGSAKWPPPQMKVITGCQSKTPVAQMHFVSEHLLSEGNRCLLAYLSVFSNGWSKSMGRDKINLYFHGINCR